MPTWTSAAGTLEYRDVGSGIPLVLLHAFPLSGEMFEAQWTGLASVARVVVPDLPGFGKSAPRQGAATPEALATDVLSLMDHLRIDSAVVGGVSMGGYVALALLRHDPARVRALVLADTQTAADDDAARDGREVLARALEERGAAAVEGRSDVLLSKRAPPELRQRVEAWMAATSPVGMAAASRGMGRRADARDILARFSGPLLVVVGQEDAVTPPEKARAMAELVPGADLVEIPRAGHLASLEQPQAFNAALARFLARVAP